MSDDPQTDPGAEIDPGADPGAEQTEPETLAVPLAALRPALEAVLMVADQPLDQLSLASAVGYPVEEVTGALSGLADEYDEQGRGFELRNVAGGWRFYTREDFAHVVEKFVLDGQQARLTQAALETLAVVAYRQPVSRSRVSAVRGVNVDGVMRTLLTRGLVEEAGTDHETGAHLYRTTSYFLERIGVTSLADLPELAPLLPELEDVADEIVDGRADIGAGAAPALPAAEPVAEETTSEPLEEPYVDESVDDETVEDDETVDEPEPEPEPAATSPAEVALADDEPGEVESDETGAGALTSDIAEPEPEPGPAPDEAEPQTDEEGAPVEAGGWPLGVAHAVPHSITPAVTNEAADDQPEPDAGDVPPEES